MQPPTLYAGRAGASFSRAALGPASRCCCGTSWRRCRPARLSRRRQPASRPARSAAPRSTPSPASAELRCCRCHTSEQTLFTQITTVAGISESVLTSLEVDHIHVSWCQTSYILTHLSKLAALRRVLIARHMRLHGLHMISTNGLGATPLNTWDESRRWHGVPLVCAGARAQRL